MQGTQEICQHRRCISWTAVLTGALVGIGLTFLFNLFNIAIGVTAFSMTDNGPTLLIGGFLALLISTIVAMYMSGYVAGFLGRGYCPKRNSGIVYGFATWALALILTAFLTSHVGRFIYSYSQFVTDPTTIVITENKVTPAVDAKVNSKTARPQVIVNVDKATATVGIGAFIIFILFAVGALASCIGGVYGMAHKDDTCTGKRV